MTRFRYEAFSASGETARGIIEAESLPSALELLNQRGIRPFLAEPDRDRATGKPQLFALGKPSLAWRAKIVRQLATLLAAGITLDRSLLLLSKQGKSRSEQKIMADIGKAVNSGQSLSAALAGQNDLFQADEIGLVKASEQTGSLVPVLEDLAALLERRIQIRSKLTSALVYPAFLLTLAPISLIIIATVLVPNLAPLFEGAGAAMPFALQAMIWFSNEFRERGILWLALLAIILVGSIWLSGKQSVKEAWNKLAVRLPFWGVIKRKTEAARICRTLGSLIRSGAPLQTALQAIVDVTHMKSTQESLKQVQTNVSAGRKLGDALNLVSSIDPSSLQMIAIGEETNKLDAMLLYVADGEEKAVASYIDRLMTLLTPLLTILLGLFVGGIVMSIMRAILSVNELVSK